ncbi:DJ-1/PfpI family protein [Brevibacterium casei]|uniref:DJ-1/PfpI family protein n=2 Tax=Brevibacterium casei TaxID=33889 RepID=A0A2H1HRW5_9MICO|nr:DJ-1/PfpI family protein [Brevibacterium casei]MCT1549442.1 DJ-1/PfpI family protein [Brevibacterium casei]MCT1560386.1 DJ-1/PfpI family protein [Brevibacterium casei]MCT2206702.1 DJ-1/PfpI family protein [Brevibacterium casei]PAK95090.1 thiamine biosynthesis protein ThiJ [Brevibacterium casei]QPR38441.1 DJ-1/PfpI family protein [Brevibacterium casei]
MSPSPRTVGIVLFEGFELLDVFGPVELLSVVPDGFAITYLAASPGPVRSSQGAEVVATDSLSDSLASGSVPDIVLVPGGGGTRELVDDHDFLDLIAAWASRAPVVTSVCTGSAVLAAAGLLEGYRATSNKRAFAWASAQGTDVEWVPHARWVEDRDRWTSSGVAAGMDMTAALIARLVGEEAATTAARTVELEVHSDPDWDPFAEHYGLGM